VVQKTQKGVRGIYSSLRFRALSGEHFANGGKLSAGKADIKDLGPDKDAVARRANRRRQAFRVTIWFLGVVIASLIPLASTFIDGADINEAPSWEALLGHGDLLIIGIVVAVAGFVEIGLSYKAIKPDRIPFVILLITAGVVVLVAQAVWYGDISANLLSHQGNLAVDTIAVGSVACYSASVFCGCVGVILSGGDR
jgi:uncharacterized membrane protein